MSTGILDTDTFLLLGRIADRSSLPSEPLITTITLAELSVGPLLARSARERAARQAQVQLAESVFDPLPFDAPAARAFATVAASLRRAGRKPAARGYDAMIAAIAVARQLPLHTCNAGDFARIDGLDVVAVAHPGR
jgi:predicted nucleic acid-binding protein